MQGGFHELHHNFLQALALLDVKDDALASSSANKNLKNKHFQLKKNWFEQLFREYKSDNDPNANKKLFEKLMKAGQNFDDVNQLAAIKYIDLYISLLDKLTDCDEVFNSAYNFPFDAEKSTESFIEFCTPRADYEVESAEDDARLINAKGILKSKPNCIVPLIISKMHIISFQTVNSLIKNKIIMDNDNIAPSVLNLLISITKNEEKLMDKIRETTKVVEKPVAKSKFGGLGNFPMSSRDLVELLENHANLSNLSGENLSQLATLIFEVDRNNFGESGRDARRPDETYQRIRNLENLARDLSNG